MLLWAVLHFVAANSQSCIKRIAQNEYLDCKGQSQISNSTCTTSHYFSEYKNDIYTCTEVEFRLTVSNAKYSKMKLTIINLDSSDNSLRIENEPDFNLKHIGNKTYEINNNQIGLLLKSSHFFGRTQFDPRANFIMRWSPVLLSQCPEECPDSCCSQTNFKCLRKNQMCDGNWECPNGQDEVACRECDKSETLVRCPGDLFFTKENRCLPIEFICDGVSDCNCSGKTCSLPNGYEEKNCAKCSEGAFHCTSSDSCIPEREQCDMRADCTGGEDELNCPIEDKRKVLTAAIVGSLGCGVLFVIALGCTRRLFHVQNSTSCSSRARRNLQSLANILQVREAPPTYEVAMGIENQLSIGSRQSRSRPWRLTRSGLRRDSRRARRRHRIVDGVNPDEPNEVHVTPSVEQVRVTEQPIASTESLDSFDSLPQPEPAPQPEGTDFGGAQPPAESEATATNTNDDKE